MRYCRTHGARFGAEHFIGKRPQCREGRRVTQRVYEQTAKAAARMARYNATEKGRLRQHTYNHSEKGHARTLAQNWTEKGKLRRLTWEWRHAQVC